jgi:hypothetical protein
MWFGEATRFPKEYHLPDWARLDNKVTKGELVEYIILSLSVSVEGKMMARNYSRNV